MSVDVTNRFIYLLEEVIVSEVIKMDYSDMEEMSRTFQQGSAQLKETLKEMRALAEILEGGALLGQGGTAFTNAIQTKLVPAIDRLDEKFEELRGDIVDAVNYMKDADRTAKNYYQS